MDPIRVKRELNLLKDLPWLMRPWLQKLVWLTFGCKLGQNDPIVMKLKLDMCHLRNVYNKFEIGMLKKVRKTQTYGRTDILTA